MVHEITGLVATSLIILSTGEKSGEVVLFDWKIADVASIFKKGGEGRNLGNYRSISLASTLYKALEEILKGKTIKRLGHSWKME